MPTDEDKAAGRIPEDMEFLKPGYSVKNLPDDKIRAILYDGVLNDFLLNEDYVSIGRLKGSMSDIALGDPVRLKGKQRVGSIISRDHGFIEPTTAGGVQYLDRSTTGTRVADYMGEGLVTRKKDKVILFPSDFRPKSGEATIGAGADVPLRRGMMRAAAESVRDAAEKAFGSYYPHRPLYRLKLTAALKSEAAALAGESE
jgi:hypothetical protein